MNDMMCCVLIRARSSEIPWRNLVVAVMQSGCEAVPAKERKLNKAYRGCLFFTHQRLSLTLKKKKKTHTLAAPPLRKSQAILRKIAVSAAFTTTLRGRVARKIGKNWKFEEAKWQTWFGILQFLNTSGNRGLYVCNTTEFINFGDMKSEFRSSLVLSDYFGSTEYISKFLSNIKPPMRKGIPCSLPLLSHHEGYPREVLRQLLYRQK